MKGKILEETKNKNRVKPNLTRPLKDWVPGLWRIDYLALTHIRRKVKPLDLIPESILRQGKPDPTALAQIKSPTDYLLSMPGSEYQFNFRLPQEDQDYELFLYAKGYYLEWMRTDWLKDKDIPKLREMIGMPRRYLRSEAASYKKYETWMEEEFWNSKINTKTFSYYEN